LAGAPVKYPYGGCSTSGACISKEAFVTTTGDVSLTVPFWMTVEPE
jgi:hypothetical protein